MSVGDYTIFLNAVATESDPYNLWTSFISENDSSQLIERTGEEGHYTYIATKEKENTPITMVSWFSALRYCNWLHNGQPRGKEDASTTENGAYTLTGSSTTIITANAGARYFLPNENQWYKAIHNASTDEFSTSGTSNYGVITFSTLGEWTSSSRASGNSFNCSVSSTSTDDSSITHELRPPNAPTFSLTFRVAAPAPVPTLEVSMPGIAGTVTSSATVNLEGQLITRLIETAAALLATYTLSDYIKDILWAIFVIIFALLAMKLSGIGGPNLFGIPALLDQSWAWWCGVAPRLLEWARGAEATVVRGAETAGNAASQMIRDARLSKFDSNNLEETVVEFTKLDENTPLNTTSTSKANGTDSIKK